MIISGGSRCNWRFFARHLMSTKENEQVRVAEVRGLTSDTVLESLREMDAIASGTRCKNFFYHVNINPRYGEHLTEEQWEQAADRLERNLGLTGHARFVVEHDKDGRVHRHIVWSRIDPDTMKAVSDSFTARDHERTSRELEAAFGLEPVESVLVKDRDHERPERGPKDWENFRGKGSGIDPKQVTEEVTALWNGADSGPAFAAALADHGYILCKGDKRDFVIVDPAGDEHSLARRIEGQKTKDIRARMQDVGRDELPTVAEGRELAKGRQSGREDDAATPPQDVIAQPAATIAGPETPGHSSHTRFWETIAEYALEVLEVMRRGHAEDPWTVEECKEFLQADRPPQITAAPTIDSYAAPMEEAIREDGAIPTRDGQSWWQRAGNAIGNAVETATTWAKGRWNSFVERVERSRDSEPDAPENQGGFDGPDGPDMEV